MTNRSFKWVLVVGLVFGLGTPLLSGAKSAQASYSLFVASAQTPAKSYAQSHLRFRPIASLTKLMLALVVADHLDGNLTWTAPPNFQRPLGSTAGIDRGRTYTVSELLAGLMVPSGNDAAKALESIFSSKGQNAVALMNKKAKALGLKQTIYGDVIGFGCPRCGSTAQDQWWLLKKVAAHPRLGKLLRTRGQLQLPFFGQKKSVLLKSRLTEFSLPGSFLGGKTGQTRAAGQCLAGIWKVKGKEVMAVGLGGHSLEQLVKVLDQTVSRQTQ